MHKNRNPILLGCLLAGACLAPLAAQASPIVTMQLTGVQGPSLAGVSTDPYYATIGQGSQPVAVYCDDFFDEVSIGQVWQAQVTNMSALSSSSPVTGLMFDTSDAQTQERNYMAAAWLAEQIAAQNQSLSSGQKAAELDSYALWYVFDQNALGSLSSSDRGAAQSAYDLALQSVANDTPDQFSNVSIYTPLDAKPGCADSQEYLTVNVPEPSTLSLALLGLGAAGFAARRRRRTA